jgi:hypothetical protein
MGQDLFNPPNVKGWPGGEAWINSDSLLKRKQFLARLGRGSEMPVEEMRFRREKEAGESDKPVAKLAEIALVRAGQRADLAGWMRALPGLNRRVSARAVLLAQAPVDVDLNASQCDDVDYIVRLLQDPVYQLK